MAGLSRAEMETIICRAADEKTWSVFSEDPAIIRKLTRLHGKGEKQGTRGWHWKLAKNLISFRRPRVLTTEQAEALRERGRALAKLSQQKAKE